MARIVDLEDYEELQLNCEDCDWKGKGADANLIDFYGVTAAKELRCPNCDGVLATLKSTS